MVFQRIGEKLIEAQRNAEERLRQDKELARFLQGGEPLPKSRALREINSSLARRETLLRLTRRALNLLTKQEEKTRRVAKNR